MRDFADRRSTDHAQYREARWLAGPGRRGATRITRLRTPPAAVAVGLLIGLLLMSGYSPLGAQSRTLYEQPSPYNTILVVEDKPGFRTLYFERGGALQSVAKMGDPDHLELPYAKTMLSGLALCEEPGRILIVGLGGGTLPKFLHKHYPRAVIDTVDIDPDVIKVAKEFFEFREDANLRAYVSDGRKFIEERPGVYDLIFLDAFGTDSTPYHLTTREFLLAVRKALTPRGVALGNIWGRGANILYDSMVRTYLAVFDEVHLLTVAGAVNNILVALPRRLPMNTAEFASRARQVSKAKGFRFDMGDAVDVGYRQIDRHVLKGEVLTDAGGAPPAK